MNFLKNIILLILLSSNYAFAYNLPDDEPIDTIALDEVEIVANRLANFTTGAKVQKITSSDLISYNTSSLSDLLSEITPISIKSYGITGLSNVSLRGMSSNHTAVLWNGFNLQNSMNGGTDMNTLPSFLIDEINIQYGGASALFGSGAVGGVIHLNNSLKFDSTLQVGYNQDYGSFNNFFEGLKFNYSNNSFASSTRIYHDYGKNDFEFINNQQFGKPTVKQDNSASKKYGIQQLNKFKISNNQTLTTNIWLQNYYREIPAMITSNSNAANENTELMRISAAWNKNGETASIYARAYYNYESLIYTDSLIDLVSELRNESLIGEIESKISLNDNFLLNIGINNTYDKASTTNYESDHYKNKTALYSSLKYFNNLKTFATVLSIREELVDNLFTPVTFSLSSRYQIHKILSLNSNISKNYNLPSFNDLYWSPGGNPDLEAENGWSEDLGLNLNLTSPTYHLNIDVSTFNINLNNHVIWIPTSGSYWTAENVEKLWSRGLETSLNYTILISKIKLAADFLYTYTKSTYEESENTEESSVGKQLMYIPEHKGNLGVKASYKFISLRYVHNYVGKRYITKDNSGSVDAYKVANLSLGGSIKLKSSDIKINFKINNIWNRTYEVMAFYAMPLRYYSISLSYNFNKQLN